MQLRHSKLSHLTSGNNLQCFFRTTFYSTLARLLFMDEQPSKFKAFVAPLQNVLQGLAQAAASATSATALRQAVPKSTVIGLFRDLRGIAAATNSRRTYTMLFDWLYPTHFPVVINCLEVRCCVGSNAAILQVLHCLVAWAHSHM